MSKQTAAITRSLRAGMQAELGDIERAAASGTRDAGRGLKPTSADSCQATSSFAS